MQVSRDRCAQPAEVSRDQVRPLELQPQGPWPGRQAPASVSEDMVPGLGVGDSVSFLSASTCLPPPLLLSSSLTEAFLSDSPE